MSGTQDDNGAASTESIDEIIGSALAHSRRRRSDGSLPEEARERPLGHGADMAENPFHAAVFRNEEPEVVKELVATKLSYDVALDKAENRARLADFEHFRAWLMQQRKDLAQQIIRLTDTDAFSELKAVFDEMNRGMLDFERQLQPLTDLLDAVYRLRTASGGEIVDVLQEIQEDQEADLRNRARKKAMAEEQQRLRGRIKSLRHEIDLCRGDRAWLGIGGIKARAQRRIEELEGEIEKIEQKIVELQVEIDAPDPVRESRFEAFAADKAKLRQLLDIGSDEHRRRQESLVEAANHFVDMAQERVQKVLSHLEGINRSVERLGEGNARLREVYAVISEAVHDAETRNLELRDSLSDSPEDETSIANLKRTNAKMAVEDHITALVNAKADTIETFGDLTAESYRIKTIRDSNYNQVARTRALSTKGVAGIAGRLSTVLQGVSTAALGESSAIAKQTLARMNEQTTRFSHKEALKNAMSVQADNAAIAQAIEELEGYAKVARAATEISRDGLEDMRTNLSRLEHTLEDVSEAVREAVAASADVLSERRGEADGSRRLSRATDEEGSAGTERP